MKRIIRKWNASIVIVIAVMLLVMVIDATKHNNVIRRNNNNNNNNVGRKNIFLNGTPSSKNSSINNLLCRGGSSSAGAGTATTQEEDKKSEEKEIDTTISVDNDDESSKSNNNNIKVDNEEILSSSSLQDEQQVENNSKEESEEDNNNSKEFISENDNDDDNDNNNNTVVLSKATTLRQKGKTLHDEGNLEMAAEVFAEAAESLMIRIEENNNDDESLMIRIEDENIIMEDYCTCRLHEALCYLKMENYELCIDVCTTVLEEEEITSVIRARAHHRRAKAYLQLNLEDEALQDARSAAFLGDRKAVAFYGKLMRGNFNEEDTIASPPMLKDLLLGKNPFLEPSSLSSSLLSTNNNNENNLTSKLTSSILGQLLGGKGSSSNNDPTDDNNNFSNIMAEAPSLLGKGGTGGLLAKSLLSSLTKRLEKDPYSICKFLHKADASQVQSFGALAGFPISSDQASKVTRLCHAVTPKLIRRTMSVSKKAWYGYRLLTKTGKVIHKYKNILILWALLFWIQSAIQRPYIVKSKK